MGKIEGWFGNRITTVTRTETIDNHMNQGPAIIKAAEVLAIVSDKKRIRIISSFNALLLKWVKAAPFARWDTKNKWWTMPFSPRLMEELQSVTQQAGLKLVERHETSGKGADKPSPSDIPNYRHTPEEYLAKLTEMRYSNNTIRNYTASFEEFINFHHTFDIDKITEPQIVAFIRYLVTDRRVSTSKQNLAINAIKFYYEKVLQGQQKFYYVARPREEKMLPLVLSEEEIRAMFTVIANTKHKLIPMLLYASVLRLSEVTDLKISDIDADRMQIRVVQGKGKKDRYTRLSEKMVLLLKSYTEEYRPAEFLIEGEGGGAYSTRSVQQVVKCAASKAGIKKKVTPHTLRHTFATHCLEQGVDLRYIQSMLGHESSKTTEIYTHVTTKGFEAIKSPLDRLDI